MKTLTKLVSKDGVIPGRSVAKRSLFMRYGMLVCCVAMMLPIAGYLLSGGTFGDLLDDLALVVPLFACVGMHFVLHRLPGRSCHGGHEESDPPPPETTRKPGDTPSHWTNVIHFDHPDPASPSSPTNAAVQPQRRSRSFRKGAQE